MNSRIPHGLGFRFVEVHDGAERNVIFVLIFALIIDQEKNIVSDLFNLTPEEVSVWADKHHGDFLAYMLLQYCLKVWHAGNSTGKKSAHPQTERRGHHFDHSDIFWFQANPNCSRIYRRATVERA